MFYEKYEVYNISRLYLFIFFNYRRLSVEIVESLVTIQISFNITRRKKDTLLRVLSVSMRQQKSLIVDVTRELLENTKDGHPLIEQSRITDKRSKGSKFGARIRTFSFLFVEGWWCTEYFRYCMLAIVWHISSQLDPSTTNLFFYTKHVSSGHKNSTQHRQKATFPSDCRSIATLQVQKQTKQGRVSAFW